MKKLVAIAGFVIILGGLAFVFDPRIEVVNGPTSGRVMSVEEYFRQNISALSPVKETVGGTFYVTSIEAKDGKGVVAYEDGHNAYVADFSYSSEPEHGAYSIETFTLRE
jgi:hypothetical protein